MWICCTPRVRPLSPLPFNTWILIFERQNFGRSLENKRKCCGNEPGSGRIGGHNTRLMRKETGGAHRWLCFRGLVSLVFYTKVLVEGLVTKINERASPVGKKVTMKVCSHWLSSSMCFQVSDKEAKDQHVGSETFGEVESVSKEHEQKKDIFHLEWKLCWMHLKTNNNMMGEVAPPFASSSALLTTWTTSETVGELLQTINYQKGYIISQKRSFEAKDWFS